VQHYSYKYTAIGSQDAAKGRWWKRRHIGEYLPPVSLESIQHILDNMGVELPRRKGKKKK